MDVGIVIALKEEFQEFFSEIKGANYSGPICQDSKTASFKVDYVSLLS